MLDIGSMVVFARVVEAGGFSAAARRLDLSKSAVSKQISRLEARLGVRLLNRSTRRISLTEAGRVYYEGCQRTIEAAESAESALGGLTERPSGHLRVSAPMSFGIGHVAPLLGDFLRRYPDITMDLELNDRQVDLIAEGFDLAIRIGELPDSSLVARRLAPSLLLLCAAPSYLERQGIPEQPEDLSDHRCLIYSYGALGNRWRFRGPEADRRVKIAGPLAVNNGEVLAQAAVDGLGIVALPSFIVCDALRSGRLVPVLPDWHLAERAAVHAVYPAARHLSPKIRAFVDFLVEVIGPTPYWDEIDQDTGSAKPTPMQERDRKDLGPPSGL